MPNLELEKYIKAAKEKGISEEIIKSQLIKTGWPEHEVTEALSPQAQNSVNLPPPPVPQFGMWIAFQYVILFITLYASATSLGGILHDAVDRYIPDLLSKTYTLPGFNDTLLKIYLAAIIVTFPVFAILFVTLKKQVLEKPAVRNLRARKQLIYITLVGTFIIMVIHLISTIYGFLNGSATIRSLAHFGVTVLIAGSIFLYFLNEVREDRKTL